MDLEQVRNAYMDDGFDYENATARTSQDAFLTMVAQSEFAQKVAFKGGVVVQQVTGDRRRATRDIDFDFMRYSIVDESIMAFVEKLDGNTSGLHIRVAAPIEELKHQDYDGKRVHVEISDQAGTAIATKLDIGVHKNLGIGQRRICFDLAASDEGVSLLANTDEQMVSEKLRSLLRIGAASTRYKDVFDVYYVLVLEGADTERLQQNMDYQVFSDGSMRENDWNDVYARLAQIFGNRRFMGELARAKNNWLELPPEEVTQAILAYVESLS